MKSPPPVSLSVAKNPKMDVEQAVKVIRDRGQSVRIGNDEFSGAGLDSVVSRFSKENRDLTRVLAAIASAPLPLGSTLSLPAGAGLGDGKDNTLLDNIVVGFQLRTAKDESLPWRVEHERTFETLQKTGADLEGFKTSAAELIAPEQAQLARDVAKEMGLEPHVLLATWFQESQGSMPADAPKLENDTAIKDYFATVLHTNGMWSLEKAVKAVKPGELWKVIARAGGTWQALLVLDERVDLAARLRAACQVKDAHARSIAVTRVVLTMIAAEVKACALPLHMPAKVLKALNIDEPKLSREYERESRKHTKRSERMLLAKEHISLAHAHTLSPILARLAFAGGPGFFAKAIVRAKSELDHWNKNVADDPHVAPDLRDIKDVSAWFLIATKAGGGKKEKQAREAKLGKYPVTKVEGVLRPATRQLLLLNDFARLYEQVR
jgi:hypothetical protein